MRHRVFAAAALAAAAFAAPAAGQLMIPDSGTGDRIMFFSKVDGSPVDLDWITDLSGEFVFSTPKEAITVGGQIWVTDQLADAIHRFDGATRAYLGSITTASDGLPLDNIRGLGTDGATVYVCRWPSVTTARGIVSFSTDGTPAGFFPINASNFDVEPFESDLLISNSTTDNIERWTTGGVFVGNFAVFVDFPEQVVRQPDGSVLAVSSIAAAGVEGVYHFNADGSLRKFIDTEVMKQQIGEHVPRGVWLLDDGGYLISASTGIYKAVETSPGVFTFLTMAAGVSGQHIGLLAENDEGCLADYNGDDQVNSNDISAFLTAWLDSVQNGNLIADFNVDGAVNSNDISAFLTSWLDAVQNGC